MQKVTTSEPITTASTAVIVKANEFHSNGKVRKVSEDRFSRTFKVRADHGLTYTVLQNRENIDADRCTCAWNRYQPFNEAICSHALAARFEATVPTSRWRRILLRLAERIGR